MQRCAAAALAVAATLICTTPAVAQIQRPFPANALRGEAVFQPAPDIVLNGEPARLAPGARIRNTDNLIVMPSHLVGGQAEIHYTVDPFGLVKDVWILTPAERAKKPWPRTPQEAAAWVYDASAQAWSKP